MSETDLHPESPQTASCAIPLIVLGSVIVLLFIAFPISRKIVGNPLREMEDVAAEVAVKYMLDSRDTDTDFARRMKITVGTYKSSRLLKLGTEKGNPPKVYATFSVVGSAGEGIATIEIESYKDGSNKVTDALIVKK